eukprot:363925-Chlamydomonas_euryale.AAC.7
MEGGQRCIQVSQQNIRGSFPTHQGWKLPANTRPSDAPKTVGRHPVSTLSMHPTPWPHTLNYSKAAVESAGWELVRELHAETLRALKRDCKGLDWTGQAKDDAA